jgi:catechol 2,3-dioxygenase-like lactoylglutathione lyase family enzyme
MSGLDHASLSVGDYPAARRFYDAALQELGIALRREMLKSQTGKFDVAIYGRPDASILVIAGGGKATPRVHLAFIAADHAEVDAFYKAAMAASGTDNGPPGIRANYNPNYYAAFVFDPDGNNIEAVCRRP